MPSPRRLKVAAALLAGGILFANVFVLAAARFGEISAARSYDLIGGQLRDDIVSQLTSTLTFEAPPVVVRRSPPSAGSVVQDAGDGGPTTATEPTTGNTPNGPLPLPAPTPIHLPFAISMAVDRTVAAPGDVLTYTATVTNLSDRRRTYLLTSHIPSQTVTYCPVGPLELGDTCTPQSATGLEEHDVTAILARVRPGHARTFILQVRILPTARDGEVIINHAHARRGDLERTSPTVGSEVEL